MTKAKLMAILNTTPDSYYDISRAATAEKAIGLALKLEKEGADILDIGGESTRPGATPVSEEEELKRVIPVIKELKGLLSIPISIDTRRPSVAEAAISAGATMLNDVTGFSHPDMIRLARDTNYDICVMHMHGTPETMQKDVPKYLGGIVPYLMKWFEEKIKKLIAEGVQQEKIILDPGIGFGKTVADNLEIIHNLHLFKKLGFRILFGASRKSFLSRILNQQTAELLAPTLAVNTLALNQSVDILRVHDVKEHRAVIDFMNVYHTNVD